jgi:hypothetical protein
MLFSGLFIGLIAVAVAYFPTTTQVAAPAPAPGKLTKSIGGQQAHTDGLQWMGDLPASVADKQEDSLPLVEVITALTVTRNPSDALKAYQIIDGCESLRAMFQLDPMPPVLLSQKKRCASITDVMRRSKYDYLSTAAYAGVLGVGSEWLRHGPSGDLDALRSRPNDPLVVEWKKQARALVMHDGDQGDINALQDLINGYAGKTPIFDADPSRELAYAMAYKEVVDQLQLGMAIPGQPTDEQLAALAAKLSPEQVAWAISKARTIVAARGKRVTPANR